MFAAMTLPGLCESVVKSVGWSRCRERGRSLAVVFIPLSGRRRGRRKGCRWGTGSSYQCHGVLQAQSKEIRLRLGEERKERIEKRFKKSFGWTVWLHCNHHHHHQGWVPANVFLHEAVACRRTDRQVKIRFNLKYTCADYFNKISIKNS